MKILYKLDDLLLIKISDKKYYYGNGKNINSISFNANAFLRFNPYLEDAEDNEKVPDLVLKWIESHKNDSIINSKIMGD